MVDPALTLWKGAIRVETKLYREPVLSVSVWPSPSKMPLKGYSSVPTEQSQLMSFVRRNTLPA